MIPSFIQKDLANLSALFTSITGDAFLELHVYSIIPKIYNQWNRRSGREKKPKVLNLRAFTPEQRQAHFERVKETDGFHVGYVPLGSRLGGMICPIPLSQCGSGKKNLAKLAIKGYNEENGTTYKFVKLIRVNFSAVGGVLNFITFQAKDGKPGCRPQNFQTRVYQCIEKTEVQFCRLEQKKSTLPEACEDFYVAQRKSRTGGNCSK